MSSFLQGELYTEHLTNPQLDRRLRMLSGRSLPPSGGGSMWWHSQYKTEQSKTASDYLALTLAIFVFSHFPFLLLQVLTLQVLFFMPRLVFSLSVSLSLRNLQLFCFSLVLSSEGKQTATVSLSRWRSQTCLNTFRNLSCIFHPSHRPPTSRSSACFQKFSVTLLITVAHPEWEHLRYLPPPRSESESLLFHQQGKHVWGDLSQLVTHIKSIIKYIRQIWKYKKYN